MQQADHSSRWGPRTQHSMINVKLDSLSSQVKMYEVDIDLWSTGFSTVQTLVLMLPNCTSLFYLFSSYCTWMDKNLPPNRIYASCMWVSCAHLKYLDYSINKIQSVFLSFISREVLRIPMISLDRLADPHTFNINLLPWWNVSLLTLSALLRLQPSNEQSANTGF